MKFVDLKEQYKRYEKELQEEMGRVFENTAFINGAAIGELEEMLSDYAGIKHAVTCSSGTDAILLPLMAYNIQEGDEIIVPAFTYFASASMISFYKAIPIFIDVDPVTFNIDPEKIEEKITERTKGIIAVSLYGQCPDLESIQSIAKKHGIWVLEDGAQSFGAEYKGRKSCSITDVSTTSFFPAKPLGCYGDGGAVFTNDDNLADDIRKYRNHGQEKRYYHKYIGINGRIDTLQAAILKVKLKYFPSELKERERVANSYTEKLKNLVKIPKIVSDQTSSWAQFTIQTENRDLLKEKLFQKGIPTAIHYPMPVPKQEAFSYLNKNEKFPFSEKLSHTVLSLPMHPFLKEEEIFEISKAIREILNA